MAKKIKKGADLQQAMPSPSQTAVSGPAEEDPIDNYKVQGHLDTLMQAHGIMNDPEKMAKVHKLAGRKNAAIRSIADLHNTYNNKFGGANARKPKASLGQLKTQAAGDGEPTEE